MNCIYLKSRMTAVVFALCLALPTAFCSCVAEGVTELNFQPLEHGTQVEFFNWTTPEGGRVENLTFTERLALTGLDFSGLKVPDGLAFDSAEKDADAALPVTLDAGGGYFDYSIISFRFLPEEDGGDPYRKQTYCVTVGLRPGAMALDSGVQEHREALAEPGEERSDPQPNSTVLGIPAACFTYQVYRGWEMVGDQHVNKYATAYSASFMLGDTGVFVTSIGLTETEFTRVLKEAASARPNK